MRYDFEHADSLAEQIWSEASGTDLRAARCELERIVLSWIRPLRRRWGLFRVPLSALPALASDAVVLAMEKASLDGKAFHSHVPNAFRDLARGYIRSRDNERRAKLRSDLLVQAPSEFCDITDSECRRICNWAFRQESSECQDILILWSRGFKDREISAAKSIDQQKCKRIRLHNLRSMRHLIMRKYPDLFGADQ